MIHWKKLSKDERVEIIKPLWEDGKTATEIAKMITGCSRNAVIGYVHREGMTRSVETAAAVHARVVAARKPAKPKVFKPRKPSKPRPNNLAAFNAARRAKLFIVGSDVVMEQAEAPSPRAQAKADAFLPLPGSQPKPWLKREFGECSWIVGGEGADALSCCLPVHTGSWCRAHHKLGHQRPQDVRRWDERLGIAKARRAA